jgi:hypothetical protein
MSPALNAARPSCAMVRLYRMCVLMSIRVILSCKGTHTGHRARGRRHQGVLVVLRVTQDVEIPACGLRMHCFAWVCLTADKRWQPFWYDIHVPFSCHGPGTPAGSKHALSGTLTHSLPIYSKAVNTPHQTHPIKHTPSAPHQYTKRPDLPAGGSSA